MCLPLKTQEYRASSMILDESTSPQPPAQMDSWNQELVFFFKGTETGHSKPKNGQVKWNVDYNSQGGKSSKCKSNYQHTSHCL